MQLWCKNGKTVVCSGFVDVSEALDFLNGHILRVETFIREKDDQEMSKAREGPEANSWSNQVTPRETLLSSEATSPG